MLLAAVDFDDRRDERDDVVADRLDERRLLDGEAVRQLHQHLGAAGLARVHAARHPVDRLGGLDQLLRLRLRRLARIGQRREHALVLVELLDRRLVGDGEQHHVAAFFGLADRPHRDAIGRLVERLVVALDVLGVGQLAGRAGHAAEELQRRRDRVGRRQVIDELGADARILRVFLDLRSCTPRPASAASPPGSVTARSASGQASTTNTSRTANAKRTNGLRSGARLIEILLRTRIRKCAAYSTSRRRSDSTAGAERR